MRESEAYPALYQESAARKTHDKAIGILDGEGTVNMGQRTSEWRDTGWSGRYT